MQSDDAASSSPTQTREIYSMKNNDRPMMITHRRATLDNGAMGNSTKNRRPAAPGRFLSSSFTSSSQPQLNQQQGHHFSIPKPLHKLLTRSVDALDGPVDSENPIGGSDTPETQPEQQQILKNSSSDTELILPAPESPTDDYNLSDDENDDTLENLEAGGVDQTLNGSSNNQATPLKNTPAAFSLSMRNMPRQLSQFFMPKSTQSKSLTAQRYNRKKTVMNLLNMDVADIAKNDLSEDTKHRLKGFACFFVFALFAAALMYFLLRK